MNGKAAPSAREQISGLLFAVFLLDRDLTIIEANHAAEDMLGRSIKRLCGMPFAHACHMSDDVVTRIANAETQLVARGIAIRSLVEKRMVNMTVSPLAAYSPWCVVTLSDAGREDMRTENKTPSALQGPSVLAHEIKNPLAAIKGASQLLARRLGKEDLALTILISEEVSRIAGMIDRMQALGSRTSNPVHAINPHMIIRKAIASIGTASEHAHAVKEEFDPSLPSVMANSDALMQVLTNLLSNAIDARTAEKEPRICVRTRFVSGLVVTDQGGTTPIRLPIEIAICDNGPGLPDDIADRIFEPFVTSKRSGQGLGLPLVKKLVRDMGGRVSHMRNDRTGMTEFRVHLAVAE